MTRFLTAAAASILLAGIAAADTADEMAQLCIDEGQNPDDCRCVAEQLEEHLTENELAFMLRMGQLETRDQQAMMTVMAETGMTPEGMAEIARKMMEAEPTVREICGVSSFE